ncbi:MAG: hypothetical protein FWF94_01540 [Oscillospiraceae bacterium]|nr:hypothetical protein [Oscillospiraceae bacterium]
MRITNSEVLRKYVSGLHMNYRKQSDSQNRVISQRKFSRASQSPMEAAKALRNRKAIKEVETYQKNLETAAGIYASAEEAVMGVSSVLQTLQEKLIAGAHGTFNVPTDKQIIAEEIDKLAEQMVQLMNLIVADRRIFGGVNNETQAYKIENGRVFFNGVDVNLYSDPTQFPYGGASYIDAGLGMTFLDEYTIDPQSAIAVTFNGAKILGCGMDEVEPKTTNVQTLTLSSLNAATVAAPTNDFSIRLNGGTPQTLSIAYDTSKVPHAITTSGALASSVVVVDNKDGTFSIQPRNSTDSISIDTAPASVPAGITVTSDTVTRDLPGGNFPKNIIQLTLDAANSVRAGTDDLTALYADMVFAAGSAVSLSIASIGADSAFIEFNQERLTNNMFSLLQRENELEYIDIGEELIKQKVLEMIYNATLQMSASTIPMSIFNFMR